METRALQIERLLRDPIVGEGVLAPPYEGVVCENIRAALRLLGFRVPSGRSYDAQLTNSITEFQQAYGHSNRDGLFGPGTRRLLAETLDQKVGRQALSTLAELAKQAAPSVFLSYAWTDAAVVDKIDQWLRDHGIRVQRDNRDFKPGQQLPEAIKDALVRADKVIVIYSANSRQRDWPRLEITLAEQKENSTGEQGFIIYLVLDDTPLPKHDPNRIAVLRSGKTVRQVGEELLNGILGKEGESPRIEFDENDLL